jgi:hypothetical protein
MPWERASTSCAMCMHAPSFVTTAVKSWPLTCSLLSRDLQVASASQALPGCCGTCLGRRSGKCTASRWCGLQAERRTAEVLSVLLAVHFRGRDACRDVGSLKMWALLPPACRDCSACQSRPEAGPMRLAGFYRAKGSSSLQACNRGWKGEAIMPGSAPLHRL